MSYFKDSMPHTCFDYNCRHPQRVHWKGQITNSFWTNARM